MLQGHSSWSSPAGILLMGNLWNPRTTTELLVDTSGDSVESFTLQHDLL